VDAVVPTPTLFENVVIPDTFNVELIVVILFNNVFPKTFNDELIVDAPETNKLVKFVLFNNDVLVTCKFDIFKLLYVLNEFKYSI